MSLAKPMSTQRRSDAYARQTGALLLTPKQHRRLVHKCNHAAAPFGPVAGAAADNMDRNR